MEALVFGIIALIALKKKQERIVPEPAEFQPFDLRTLGRFHELTTILRAEYLIESGRMWPRPCPDRTAMSHHR